MNCANHADASAVAYCRTVSYTHLDVYKRQGFHDQQNILAAGVVLAKL